MNHAIDLLAALAHQGRLEAFRLLMRRAPHEVPAGEIAEALGVRATTLSNQLNQLETVGLIRARRDGRRILYAAEIERAGALLGFFARDCCLGRPEICAPAAKAFVWGRGDQENHQENHREDLTMRPGETRYHVLFLCRGNSARSIMAEAILNRLAPDRFQAYSAGSEPRGALHPETARLLTVLNHDPSAYRSKDWSEFAGDGAPEMDFVFTVCDKTANEVCPVWPGQPMSAHWGVPDPAAVEGSDAEVSTAFNEAYRMLFNRLSAFSALPIRELDRVALQKKLDEVGRMTAEDAGRDTVAAV
ncbi:MAG: metalloregulator ArsR/SmtB family transcription factor [Pseudomonadota bacterium]